MSGDEKRCKVSCNGYRRCLRRGRSCQKQNNASVNNGKSSMLMPHWITFNYVEVNFSLSVALAIAPLGRLATAVMERTSKLHQIKTLFVGILITTFLSPFAQIDRLTSFPSSLALLADDDGGGGTRKFLYWQLIYAAAFQSVIAVSSVPCHENNFIKWKSVQRKSIFFLSWKISMKSWIKFSIDFERNN